MKKGMMMLSLGLVGFIIFASCNKSNNGPSLTANEQHLSSRTWKLNGLTMPKVSNPLVDSSITSPGSDSTLAAFDAYHNFQIANFSKQTSDSISIPYDLGTWAFNNTQDSLYLQGKKMSRIWKIIQLNDTIVKATYKDSLSPSKVWIKTITLK
jgi:virulence-associated protein VapD